jgi:hypothetical protein
MEPWRDWPEAQKLQVNLRLLMARPNGRKVCNYLLGISRALLDYKSHRGGSWKHKGL